MLGYLGTYASMAKIISAWAPRIPQNIHSCLLLGLYIIPQVSFKFKENWREEMSLMSHFFSTFDDPPWALSNPRLVTPKIFDFPDVSPLDWKWRHENFWGYAGIGFTSRDDTVFKFSIGWQISCPNSYSREPAQVKPTENSKEYTKIVCVQGR